MSDIWTAAYGFVTSLTFTYAVIACFFVVDISSCQRIIVYNFVQ